MIMLKIQTKTLSIVSGHGQAPLSKEQKAFNALIKKIEAKRASLAAWLPGKRLFLHASENTPANWHP
jgi:hypothetical protein